MQPREARPPSHNRTCCALRDPQAAEARFLRALRATISAFAEPMSRILTEPERRAIFRNIKDLKDVHAALRGMINDASEAETAGEAITDLAAGVMR